MADNNKTTISISKTVRDALRLIGRKNETYDELFIRMIKFMIRNGDVPKEVESELRELIDKWMEE